MKIIKCHSMVGYTFFLPDSVPNHDYSAIVVDGKRYPIVPAYDCGKFLAVKGIHDFIGKSVSFE